MWKAAVETYHSSREHLLGEVNVHFESQKGPSREPGQLSLCTFPATQLFLLISGGKKSRENIDMKPVKQPPTPVQGFMMGSGRNKEEEGKLGKENRFP